MERPEPLKELYQKYLDGLCTSREIDVLLDALGMQGNEKLLREWIRTELNRKSIESDELALEVANNVQEKLFSQIRNEETGEDSPVVRKKIYWPQIAAAAVLLIGIALFYNYFSNRSFYTKSESQAISQNDIPPGKSSATLTLSSGRQIKLSDAIKGEIAEESGIRISKAKDGQIIYTIVPNETTGETQTVINTVETPRGGKYQVNLPDGTKVWLNAASSLRYPTKFNGTERRVELDGEAYFEVAKVRGKRMPFLVGTKKQIVEVLGTHFNVNNYADEETVKTTLLEGSVKIRSSLGETAFLKPGQQAVILSNAMKVQPADLIEEMAWKNGEFIFTRYNFRTEIRKVARWYNVDIVFEESAPKDIGFGGFISDTRNISAVLKFLEQTGKVHFKIEGRRIVVTK